GLDVPAQPRTLVRHRIHAFIHAVRGANSARRGRCVAAEGTHTRKTARSAARYVNQGGAVRQTQHENTNRQLITPKPAARFRAAPSAKPMEGKLIGGRGTIRQPL